MTGRIYVHSANSDFADTDRLPLDEYLGRPIAQTFQVRGGQCACDAPVLVRIRRSGWMRLVPFLRVCRCALCDGRVLRLRRRVRSPHDPVYLPARPLRPEAQRLIALVARLPLGTNAGPRG